MDQSTSFWEIQRQTLKVHKKRGGKLLGLRGRDLVKYPLDTEK